jgi:hypothetical protein
VYFFLLQHHSKKENHIISVSKERWEWMREGDNDVAPA